MPKFIATREILHNGEKFAAGDEIDLPKKQAEPLLALGAVEKPAPSAGKAKADK